MSSESWVRLPVIDFSKQDLKPGTPEWDVLKVQVREALAKYGCFEASLDRLTEVGKPFIGAMEEIFDLPLETKKLCVSESIFGGYKMAPMNESFQIENWNVAEEYIQQSLTNILWPQGNPSFSKTLHCFTELASELDKTIRTMILESFGLDHKYVKEHMDLITYKVRLMKYEGQPQSNNDAPNLAPHYDTGLLAFLYQNGVSGLEIQNNDGEWIKVKFSPDSFIVIIGESLSVLLNGRLPCPYHRVIGNDKTRPRVTITKVVHGETRVRRCLSELERQHNGFLLFERVEDFITGDSPEEHPAIRDKSRKQSISAIFIFTYEAHDCGSISINLQMIDLVQDPVIQSTKWFLMHGFPIKEQSVIHCSSVCANLPRVDFNNLMGTREVVHREAA
ncbi:Oxoglutarate/iron-dependent dioxygenase [Corchorus capsularis]|uniref:Oxoglutarate/iron-dependent dioxygenase n=1 Tax=Corchorus capsularis TaxID=210143 RepID=A0A1R3G887_COCAP|nr:Oxoglutarate/iron-dependent dioxygenase [Corchorus capsularis]